LQAEIGDISQWNLSELFGPPLVDVRRQLDRCFVAPFGQHPLEKQRGILALEFVFLGEIDLERLAKLSVPQDGLGFARIVVAVVVEKDDSSADLGLQFAGGGELGVEKPPRKNPA